MTAARFFYCNRLMILLLSVSDFATSIMEESRPATTATTNLLQLSFFFDTTGVFFCYIHE